VGLELFAGDRIETKKGERVVIGYPNEKTTITAGSGDQDTAVRIGDTKKGKRLHLEKGILDASVDPQPADRRMIVTTAHAKAEVVGTEFGLVAESTATRIDVFEGLVRFTRLADGSSIDVTAGQFALAGEKAESYALKTYPAGTGWVDGPVIYRNDFGMGLTGIQTCRVVPVLEKRAIRHVPFDDTEGRYFRIEKAGKGGLRSDVLTVDSPNRNGPCLSFSVGSTGLHERLRAGDGFSLEFDVSWTPNPGPRRPTVLVSGASFSNEAPRRYHKELSGLVHDSFHVRTEVVRLKHPERGDVVDVKTFRKGALDLHYTKEGGLDDFVGIILGNYYCRASYDNLVIRALVAAPATVQNGGGR
jgi:hypothetical protein